MPRTRLLAPIRFAAFAAACSLSLHAAIASPGSSPAKQAPAKDHHATDEKPEKDNQWTTLFNGKDLTGWTPKFTGEEAGVNYKDTFTVKDGLLTVDYSQWDNFGGKFGHLFYESEFSHYILRVEYRFVGEQCPGGPGWAFMNSGVMFHGQSLESMGKGQQFPNSIEAQLLGQAEDNPADRPTANVCTPGTDYVQNGKLIKAHCNKSSSKTYRGDQWVTFELEVHGHEKVIHRINGETVFEYEQPQLSADVENKALHAGTISLQAESHPVQFRKVEIKELEKE